MKNFPQYKSLKFLQCVASGAVATILLTSGCVIAPASVTTTAATVSGSLELGKTTLAQVADRYKSPAQILERQFHGKPVRIVQYVQSLDPTSKPSKAEILASRTATFFFAENILVGHNFESSWASDTTDFDSAFVAGLQPGKATRAEVLKVLGPPAGQYQYPLIEENNHEALVYLRLEPSPNAKGVVYNRREVTITIDPAGTVKSIKYGLHDSSPL